MRTSWAAILTATALVACTGTQGDLLRSMPDAGSADAPVGPPVVPASSWQIQLTGTIDTTIDAQVYMVDIDVDADAPGTLAALHAQGRIVICYFSAGTREPFRSDAMAFPASAIGDPVTGYPNENWLDVTNPTVRSIMAERMRVAATRGCDGIHPSGIAAFQSTTGFPLTRDDSVNFATFLADAAHANVLSIGLVDGDAAFSQALVAKFDWTVVWSCIDTQCDAATSFLQAGKASFLVEYGDASRATQVCPAANSSGLSAIIKHNALDAFRVGCK
jgi:hypothetical protein